MQRRLIYIFVLVTVALPLLFKFTLKPARMATAESAYSVVDKIKADENGIVLIAMDIGPSVKAETVPQLDVLIEHLVRKKIKFAVFSLLVESKPFLEGLPNKVLTRLQKEDPSIKLEYGKDWVNLGYKPFVQLFLEGLSKTEDMPGFLGKDANNNDLKAMPIFKNIKTLKDIPLVVEVTGSTIFGAYIQFLQSRTYRPPILHGCTSITVPEAYIYLDSKQIVGLLEGLSGAAWYSEILKEKYPLRAPDSAILSNTALGVGQLTVMFLILIGNLIYFMQKKKS